MTNRQPSHRHLPSVCFGNTQVRVTVNKKVEKVDYYHHKCAEIPPVLSNESTISGEMTRLRRLEADLTV